VLDADPLGGVEAFAGVGRGHADVHHHRVGRVGAHPAEQLLGIPDPGGDPDADGLQYPSEALAEQHRVVGDHDPHGSSAVTQVPAPAGLCT
jgi:hypothetical protein